jgi:hypothetical protein
MGGMIPQILTNLQRDYSVFLGEFPWFFHPFHNSGELSCRMSLVSGESGCSGCIAVHWN